MDIARAEPVEAPLSRHGDSKGDKQLSLARKPANSFAHDPLDALVRDQPHDSDRDI